MNPTLDAVIQTIVKACSNIVFAVILFFVGKWAINKITKLLGWRQTHRQVRGYRKELHTQHRKNRFVCTFGHFHNKYVRCAYGLNYNRLGLLRLGCGHGFAGCAAKFGRRHNAYGFSPI